MISADLLHALGYEEDSYDELTTNRILNDSNYPSLNDLMVECKEWVLKCGYLTHSIRNLIEYIVYVSGDCKEPSEDFRCSTEPEAVFQACQWVLENKDNK